MSLNRITMLDVAKRVNGSREVGLIEANILASPEAGLFPSRTISGTSYHTLIRNELPTTGFQNVGEGFGGSKSEYETRLVQCHNMGGLLSIPTSAANADVSPEELKTDEAMGMTESALRTLSRQVYYGSQANGDEKGFPGLQQLVDPDRVLKAGGSTANEATSVYLIRFGVKDVQLCLGNNSALTVPPFREELVWNPNSEKFVNSWVSTLESWVGLQCVNKNAVVRIANITDQDGFGLTDPLIARAMRLFPTGYTPDVIMVNKRAGGQLQEARSANGTLNVDGYRAPGGEAVNADIPMAYRGIPIVHTDGIQDNEPIIA